jgi:predicted ester cyclase
VSEQNKALVRAYFAALDRRDHAAATELFSPDCVVHRSDVAQPIVGRDAMASFGRGTRPVYSAFRTSVEDLIAEGDRVVARIRHEVTFQSDWQSPIGHVAAAGRDASWVATAIFRIQDGLIAEEWVVRDDIGLLKQLGALPTATGPR